MKVDLDSFLRQDNISEEIELKDKYFRPHFLYALFSFNKEMFGWVYYDWYTCNCPLDPTEYDCDLVKGFQILNEGNMEQYKCDKELAEAQKNYDLYGEGCTGWGVDWEFMDKVIAVPVGFALYERFE